MSRTTATWRGKAVVAAMLSAALAGCSTGTSSAPPSATDAAPSESVAPPASSETPGYTFLLMGALVHPFYGPMPDGIRDAAEAFAISPEPTFVMPQQFDPAEQNSIIDSYVAQGLNGLALQPADPVAINQKLDELKGLGIPSVGIAGCPAEPTPAVVCLGALNEESGYNAAAALIEALGGEGEIIHFTGQPEDVNTGLGIQGVERAVAEHPGITLIKNVTGMDAGPAAAEAGVTAEMAAHGDTVDGIIATSGVATDVIANYLRRTNNQQVKYVGLNQFEVILQAIRDGYAIGTLAHNPYGMAFLAVQTLRLLNDGCTYTGEDYLVNTGDFYIDLSNIDTWQQEMNDFTKQASESWPDSFTCPA